MAIALNLRENRRGSWHSEARIRQSPRVWRGLGRLRWLREWDPITATCTPRNDSSACHMNSNAENDLAPTMRMLLGELLDDPRLYRRAHHGSERQARGLCPRERYRQPPGHHSGPSDIPRLRHRSAHFTPASHCCKIPMVWSSVRIVRFIARPFHGADSRRD